MGTSPADLNGHLRFAKLFLLLDSFPGNAVYLGLLGSMPSFVDVGKIAISSTVKLWCLLRRLVSKQYSFIPNQCKVKTRDIFLSHPSPNRPMLLWPGCSYFLIHAHKLACQRSLQSARPGPEFTSPVQTFHCFILNVCSRSSTHSAFWPWEGHYL